MYVKKGMLQWQKNPKKSTFLLRVEKSVVAPSVLVVVRLTPKGKNKRVRSKPTWWRLTKNAEGPQKVFQDVGFVSFEGQDWNLNACKIQPWANATSDVPHWGDMMQCWVLAHLGLSGLLSFGSFANYFFQLIFADYFVSYEC